MSAVIAEPAAASAASAPRRGKKKLIVILAAVLLVLAALGGGAIYFMKKKAAQAAAEAAADEEGAVTETVADKRGPVSPPTYLPLEPFIVNLADRDSDRYAQIGITLELQNPASAEQFKLYMPAVRNAILMVITRKSSRDLLDPMGKEALAEQIKREAVRPMGIEIAAPEPVTLPGGEAASGAALTAPVSTETAASTKKPKRKAEVVKNPIQAVNFSSFIIQ